MTNPEGTTHRTSTLARSLGFGLATAVGLATPAAAQIGPGGFTSQQCQPLHDAGLDVDVLRSGIRLTYAGDRYATCDEAMVVTSYSSAGPVVDNHFDPVVDQAVVQVSALEAAGPSGVLVDVAFDPCWAGIQVHRDGDTLVWEHVDGDGCELTVTTEFAGAPSDTEIHVVQQSGNIQPPHIFEHVDDDTTVLSGLPDGTWYVKVYEGAIDGTTMAVDGGAPAEVEIVHGVADGSTVEIHHPTELGLAAPGAPPVVRYELEPVYIKSWSISGVAELAGAYVVTDLAHQARL